MRKDSDAGSIIEGDKPVTRKVVTTAVGGSDVEPKGAVGTTVVIPWDPSTVVTPCTGVVEEGARVETKDELVDTCVIIKSKQEKYKHKLVDI